MPVFLIHGFKWARPLVRQHVILQNVNDAAPDYLMQATTPAALKKSLSKLYPAIMKRIPEIHFIEQYDPEDTGPDARCQPFAFVADKVIEIRLSASIQETMNKNIMAPAAWHAFTDLKEAMVGEAGELGWFVVYNGDPERAGNDAPSSEQSDEEAGEQEATDDGATGEEASGEEAKANSKKGKATIFKRLFRRSSGKSKGSAVTKESSTTRNTSTS